MTGSWTFTGSMSSARNAHTATLLASGEVLVAGGINFITALSSSELYNPSTGAWTKTGDLNVARDESDSNAARERTSANRRRD